MASKITYECYVCKKNGFPETRVFLDGKTENGKTIYKNEDMSPHIHKDKQKQQQQQSQNQSNTTATTTVSKEDRIINMLNGLNLKMNEIVSLLQKRQQQ